MVEIKKKLDLFCSSGPKSKLCSSYHKFIYQDSSINRIRHKGFYLGKQNSIKDTLFGNSNHLYGIRQEKAYKEYQQWMKYNFNRHYSTHDWLAHIPLELILRNPIKIERWNSIENSTFWNKRRIKLYLYGTSAPDYRSIKVRGLTAKFDKITHKVLFRNGQRYKVWQYYNWRAKDIDLKPFDDAIDCVRQYEQEMFEYFNDGDFIEGVFYLGIIAHYIADCACFTHTINYLTDNLFLRRYGHLNNAERFLKFIHINRHLRDKISELTDLKMGWNQTLENLEGQVYDYKNRYEFFCFGQKDNCEEDLLIPIRDKTLSATEAVLDTAKDTYYDSENWRQSGPFTASYMLANYEDFIQNEWNNLRHNWQNDSTYNINTIKYLRRIQKSLKTAIINTGGFLNATLKKIS